MNGFEIVNKKPGTGYINCQCGQCLIKFDVQIQTVLDAPKGAATATIKNLTTIFGYSSFNIEVINRRFHRLTSSDEKPMIVDEWLESKRTKTHRTRINIKWFEVPDADFGGVCKRPDCAKRHTILIADIRQAIGSDQWNDSQVKTSAGLGAQRWKEKNRQRIAPDC